MEQIHYYAIETKENELKHYGVKGMHWGIRRYQPYTSNPRKGGKTGKFIGKKSKVVKDEKGMDPVTAAALAVGGVAALKAGKAFVKYQWQKHIAKKGAEKALKEQEKRQEQIQEQKRKNEEWEKKKAELKKRPINDPTDDEKPYMRSPEDQKKALDLAKNEDKFDIEFLETIQNDYFLNNDDPKNKVIREKEYKKYLQNPMRYMQTHDTVEEPPQTSDSKSGLFKGNKDKAREQMMRLVRDQQNQNSQQMAMQAHQEAMRAQQEAHNTAMRNHQNMMDFNQMNFTTQQIMTPFMGVNKKKKNPFQEAMDKGYPVTIKPKANVRPLTNQDRITRAQNEATKIRPSGSRSVNMNHPAVKYAISEAKKKGVKDPEGFIKREGEPPNHDDWADVILDYEKHRNKAK